MAQARGSHGVPAQTPPLDPGGARTARSGFAASQADHIARNIGLADTKATWTFAVLAGAIAYFASQAPLVSVILSGTRPWATILGITGFVGLALGAVAAFLVIVPRLSGSRTGMYFFDAVAARSDADAYLDELLPLTEEALLEAKLRHNFEVARVCAGKFRMLRLAMWSGLAGLALATVLIAESKMSASPANPANAPIR